MNSEENISNRDSKKTFQRAQEICDAIEREIRHVYVGVKDVSELLLITLISKGHILLEGVPGTAKTTLAKTFAKVLGCDFQRVQFTSDLLPSDITGTYVLAPDQKQFYLREGPLFSNVILADEINRSPSKTQSALLEAMQEKQVTIEGETRELPSPFIVIATQNPAEYSGTYPLPEAQLDRFLIRVMLGYPSLEEEQIIAKRFLRKPPSPSAKATPQTILELQHASEQIHIEDSVINFVTRFVKLTRQNKNIALGASPRACLALLKASQALALIRGREYVIPNDVISLVEPVLAHRIVLSPEAQFEGKQPSQILKNLMDQTPHFPG